MRCSASFLVNLHEVTSVQGDEAIVGGDRLPVSKSKRKEFLTALARYQGGLQ